LHIPLSAGFTWQSQNIMGHVFANSSTIIQSIATYFTRNYSATDQHGLNGLFFAAAQKPL
jgi:hypothetical protein